MNKLIRYSLLVIMAASLGCTKDVEIDLPEYIPTLVINSYISPLDSGVLVYVNLSKSAYNDNNYDVNNVTNATVKISDGVNSKTLTFFPVQNNQDFSFYFIDSNSFKITAGKTYTLNVTTPDGKAVSASTTIPEIVAINSLDYTLTKTQFGDSVYKMNFTFKDPSGQADYYKFGTYVVEIDTVKDSILQTSINDEYGTYFYSDGNLITESVDAYKPYSSSPLTPEQIRFIDFSLFHLTREYYLYHLSIENYGGGPFTEPSVPFTNVVGGVGVFAGYNYDKRVVR